MLRATKYLQKELLEVNIKPEIWYYGNQVQPYEPRNKGFHIQKKEYN